MLSMKDNFLTAIKGNVPDFVPRYSIFWGMRPSIVSEKRNPDGTGFDMFGVEWVVEGSAVQAAIPKPGDFMLKDIRNWRDVVKFPDYSEVDWELMAQRDLADRDPELPRGGGTAGIGFFQALMAFMGFNEGLIACFEEPDEVKALNEYLLDGWSAMGKNFIQYYKPEYGTLADDIAHETNPFISLPMFQDLFSPYWRRYIKIFKDVDLPAVHHNCGHFEEFLDDVVDMGFNAWDPAQVSNDLVGIKAKFGNRLMICGGLDTRPFLNFRDATEEQIRGAVKKLLDELAPGGGYAFLGGAMGTDPVAAQRSEWILDEYEKLKATYYN